MEVSLREIANSLQARTKAKEYLSDAETLLLKQAWADLAIGIVDASGHFDQEHQEAKKEDRYAEAMKVLL